MQRQGFAQNKTDQWKLSGQFTSKAFKIVGHVGSRGKEIRKQEDAFGSLSDARSSAVNDRWLRQFQVGDLDDWVNSTCAERFSKTNKVAVRSIEAAAMRDQQRGRFQAHGFFQGQSIPSRRAT